MLGPHAPQGLQELLATLTGNGRRLGIVLDVRRDREVGEVVADLPRALGLPLPVGAQTGVDRYLVKPGTEGTLTPELPYVSPNADPDLLARVLSVAVSQYPRGHPVDQPGVLPDQAREGFDVAPRCLPCQVVVLKGHARGVLRRAAAPSGLPSVYYDAHQNNRLAPSRQSYDDRPPRARESFSFSRKHCNGIVPPEVQNIVT